MFDRLDRLMLRVPIIIAVVCLVICNALVVVRAGLDAGLVVCVLFFLAFLVGRWTTLEVRDEDE